MKLIGLGDYRNNYFWHFNPLLMVTVQLEIPLCFHLQCVQRVTPQGEDLWRSEKLGPFNDETNIASETGNRLTTFLGWGYLFLAEALRFDHICFIL